LRLPVFLGSYCFTAGLPSQIRPHTFLEKMGAGALAAACKSASEDDLKKALANLGPEEKKKS